MISKKLNIKFFGRKQRSCLTKSSLQKNSDSKYKQSNPLALKNILLVFL